MAKGMLREAMSDMAETIRRVFHAPDTRAPSMRISEPFSTSVGVLGTAGLAPAYRFEPHTGQAPSFGEAREEVEPMTWTAVVKGEPGWASWSPDTEVCRLPLFQAEQCRQLPVPSLPSRAATRRAAVEGFAFRSRSGWQTIPAPPVAAIRPKWAAPEVHAGLARILTLPLAVRPEDLGRLSKAVWMRYTLQLVRATGQNIRNLEILGLYQIPAKGTRQVRHEPATGRLLVTLGPEAGSSRRSPFILARQKDDNAVVCCFVEET